MTQKDRERIRGTADRLRQEGTRVTTRAVYDALGRKGSYNAMAAVVADWRAETDYQPEIEHHGLPLALKARFLDVGSELLEHVRAEQAAILDIERANADARRRAYEAETAEAAAMVGQLLERVSDLQAEVAHLRALTGVEVAVGSEAGVPGEATAGHQAGVEADHLWDSIAEEIRAMLKERGPMWASEIFASLPVETRQRFLQIGLPLSVGWLGFHLRRMAGDGGAIRTHEGRFALAVEPEDEPEDQPGRNVEATRFWRLVMLEVIAIIRRAGRPMTAVEIVGELAPNTHECARRFKEIKPAMLAEKMRVRAARKEDPYFVVLEDGYFDLSKAMKLGRAAA